MKAALVVFILSVILGVTGVVSFRRMAYVRDVYRESVRLSWLTFFVEVIFFTLIVIGMSGIVMESGLLSGFLKREISSTLVRDFFESRYLKENFSENRLRQMRLAVTEALSKQPLEKGPGSFLDLLENTIYPYLDGPLREDLQICLVHTFVDLPSGRALKVKADISWNFKNLSGSPISYTMESENVMEQIPGIEPSSLFKIERLRIGGKDASFSVSRERLEDGRLRFKGRYDLVIENILPVELTTEEIIPLDDYYIFWINLPTKGLRFVYEHPPGFVPRISVFGMGKLVPELVIAEKYLHEWRYDGWFLPKQGIILSWHLPKND